MNDLEPADAVEEALRGNNVDVDTLSLGDPVSLTYITAFPGIEPNHTEVGQAALAFVELANEGEWDPVTVEATILRSDDDVQATWRLEGDWIRAYNRYELDDVELSQRILDTIDTEAEA